MFSSKIGMGDRILVMKMSMMVFGSKLVWFMVILVMKMSMILFGSKIGMVDSNSGDEYEHDGVWLKNLYG